MRLFLPCLLLLAVSAAQAQSYTNANGLVYTINGGAITITGYVGPGGPVTIPNTISNLPVTSLGPNAFDGSTSITAVVIGTNVTSIQEGAFTYCGLTNVTIPNGVTNIGDEAFYSCQGLGSVALPASITSVGITAFGQCWSLATITVDAQNPVYSSLEGALFNKGQTALIEYPAGITGSYSIPSGVTSIGEAAFYSGRLSSVTIPSTVTNIGELAFVGGPLTTIIVQAQNPVYSSLNGVLFNQSQNTLVEFPGGVSGSYTIPNTVTTIADEAFFSEYGLTGITFPPGLAGIGEESFWNCGLTSLSFPASLTNIGCSAFGFCQSLTSVSFEGNAPTVCSGAFFGDPATICYVAGTTGWTNPFAGLPASPCASPGPTGSLQVTITPTAAVSAGAQWQVDGGTWQNSGATDTNLSVGNHTVSFSTISDWTTPSPQSISVAADTITTITVTYLTNVPQTLFMSEYFDGDIYQFSPGGVPSTFASGLAGPDALAFNSGGDLFVGNELGNSITEISSAGVLTTFASNVEFPLGLAVDINGDLFVSSGSYVYEFTPGGAQSTFASGLTNPFGLAFDKAGNLFVASPGNIYAPSPGQGKIIKITPGGVQSTFVSGLANPVDLAFDSQGNLFATDPYADTITKFTTNAVASTFASGLDGPAGIAFDAAGDLFEADYSGNIYQFSPQGVRSTFASGLTDPQGLAFGPVASNLTNTIPYAASPTFGAVPLSVSFNSTNVDAAGDPITAWNWSFGDGSTSTAQNPMHTYTNIGIFSPSLIATNSFGSALIGLGPASIVVTNSTTAATWTVTGAMHDQREFHMATLLGTGKVLVAGGLASSSFLASAELYDPGSYSWSYTGSLNVARDVAATLVLPNGHVLVAGGYGNGVALNSAEIYDPNAGTWSVTGSMTTPRADHTATLLTNGLVLVPGGYDSGTWLASSELFNPASGTWTNTGTLNTARNLHTATLLPNGKVLVAGGYSDTEGALVSSELFDPTTGQWTPTGPLNQARLQHLALLLPSGKVLVIGGWNESFDLATCELYDPGTGQWTLTGSLATARVYHSANLLANGLVLVAGGQDNNYNALATSELYDPSSGTWSPTAELNTARSTLTATMLPSGQVLAAGGGNSSGLLSSSEFYTLGPAPSPTNFVAFTAYPTSGFVPLTVQFDSASSDTASNTIVAWNWAFGDGAISTAPNPTHTYNTAGTFSPTLIATNSLGGTLTGIGPASITVTNVPVHIGLVLNGGFETGDFTSWLLFGGDPGDNFVDNGSISEIPAHSGEYLAALGSVGSLSYLSQALATAPGTPYTLSLWLNSPDGQTPNEFLVSWNGNTLLDRTNLPALGWTNLQFTVSATGANTILTLGFRDDLSYLGLDDVGVFPARPNVAGIRLMGTNLVLTGINGVSGQTCYVLVSTNLTLPLSQWTRVATNVLSVSGNFAITVTNTVSRNVSRRFYLFQTQ